MIDLTGHNVIISRTDSIGDVMLTLPICTWIKSNFSEVKIHFLGSGYTKDIVSAFGDVDVFHNWTEISALEEQQQVEYLKEIDAVSIVHVFPRKEIAKIAKKAKIEYRIGTSHRLFHLLTCNVRLDFTRKRSELHESQLNHELLRPFGLTSIPTLEKVIEATEHFNPKLVDIPEKYLNAVLLHPKSQGSAKEWPVDKYMTLATKLAENGINVVFTGTENEGVQFRNEIPLNDLILDSTGQLSLPQLMSLIKQSKALVACSTGPLHIAGYTGIKTIGLFSPKRPIHPGRWKALGKNVIILEKEDCPVCAEGKDCNCILEIPVESVFEKLM